MNTFLISILEDGKVSLKTGEFSDVVHVDADNLLRELEEALGGEVVKEEHPEKQRLQRLGVKAANKFWNQKTVKAR